MRILFVGNSYTSRNDLAGMLRELAAASGSCSLETELITAGGASLRRHWNAGNARKALEHKPWHYVVLQEQSTLPLKNAARYRENVQLFDAVIRAARARTVLYLTWARQNALETQEQLTETIETVGQELDALIVPVGRARQVTLREHPEIPLYLHDGSHPTLAASYLAACVFHVTLFGRSVDGLPPPQALNLTSETVSALQSVAIRFMAGS